MLRELSERHQVVLVTTEGPHDDTSGLAGALARCERIVSIPYRVPKRDSAQFLVALACSWASSYPVDLWKWRAASVRHLIAQLMAGGRFDVVVADFLFAVPNVPRVDGTPVVFFAHNVEHMIWRRLADLETNRIRRAVLDLEWRKVRRAEARACDAAHLTIAVSDPDRDLLRRAAPRARVAVTPTGVDLDYFRPEPERERPNHLVFAGSMDWFPNEDAMTWFIDAVLPVVRRDHPSVGLTIVGRNPSHALCARASSAGVRVTGTVDDVRPYVAEGSVFVVPLRVAGGTRLKIFEALAMGKAVVSTSIGAEGLGLEPGRHLVIADGRDELARAIGTLLASPERRALVANEGRRLVERRYGWPAVARVFESHLMEVVNDGQAAGAGYRAAVS